MVGWRARICSFNSGSFRHSPDDRASVSVLHSDVLPIGASSKLVKFTRVPRHSDVVCYSDRIWRSVGPKIAQPLAGFLPEDRMVLGMIVQSVKDHQGYPEPLMRKWAEEHNAKRMMDFAISIGLVTRTGIRSHDGSKHFLTTPHFYAEVEDEFGEDVCDRVKLFLNSIRNGQYFSGPFRGQIRDPAALLRALLNKTSVGPATAIGQDYIMAEKAGIVKVERAGSQGLYKMVLVQGDVVQKTLEVVERKAILPMGKTLTPSDINEKGHFVSIPETSTRLAELPGEMGEAEREYVNAIRELQ